MTYGKANRPSRYLRTHPYRKQPCGSPRPDEEVTIGDVWNALGTVTKYVVNSVRYIVQKFTGMRMKPEVKDESTEKLERIDGDVQPDSSSSLYNPNFDKTEVFTTRQKFGIGDISPRRQMWLPPHKRPNTQHQYYPYIADRPEGLSFRSLNPRRNTMMSYVSPRTVKPSPYRRPWSSAITPNAPISRLSNWRPRRAKDSAYNQRPYFSREMDGKPSRRKLFSWGNSGSNVKLKHEDGGRNEGKIKVMFTDHNFRRASDQTEQTLERRTGEKNGMIPKPSFTARLNRSARKDNYGKRKMSMVYDRGLNIKRHKCLTVTPEKSGMDITSSRFNDVSDVLMNRPESNSDISMEEQRNASCSDKIVGNVEVNEALKVPSSKNLPISSSKSVQSNTLFATISDSSESAANSILSSDIAMKKNGLCEDVVSEKTLKPTSSATGMLGRSEKDGLKISSSTDVFNQSVKIISKTNIPVSPVKAKLTEDTTKPKAEKPPEKDTKSISNKMATITQNPSKLLAEENISFACRMKEMKRIKIRYHYVQKIESLYDRNCKDKDMEAKKSKALSMYRDKYHKLHQDHSFYTKLCEQYNVEPGEEYIGVDPDIKPDDDEEINYNKKTVSEPFMLKPNLDFAPWGDSKPKADPKRALDKPHINPFAVDTIKPADELSKKGFNFSGNIFTTDADKAPNRKLEDSSSTNLFTSPKSSNIFSGQSITASSSTNPFSPSANPAASSPFSSVFKSNPGNLKNNLFNSNDGVFKPAGGLFGSTGTNGVGVVSMDSDVPSGNNTFNSSNPFASKGQKRNINLFPSITNTNDAFSMKQGGSPGAGPFGNVKNNTNLFTTSSSRKRGFGSSSAFNPGNIGRGDAPVFSLGKVSGQVGKKKRRTIVRGRRTLSK